MLTLGITDTHLRHPIHNCVIYIVIAIGVFLMRPHATHHASNQILTRPTVQKRLRTNQTRPVSSLEPLSGQAAFTQCIEEASYPMDAIFVFVEIVIVNLSISRFIIGT